MTTKTFHQLLNDLDELSEQSGAEKLQWLGIKMQDPYFAKIVLMALDPFVTYGVRVIQSEATEIETPVNADVLYMRKPTVWEVFLDSMEQLSSREVTGNAAQDLLDGLIRNGVPKELLTRICRKDLRCGVGSESVNKIRPKYVPTFKVALAEPYEPINGPMWVSPKFDGLRCIILVDDQNVQFLSRNGLSFPSLSECADAFLAFPERNVMYDSEVINGDFLTSIGAVKQKHSKATNAQFQVFDTMPLQCFLERKSPGDQTHRLRELHRILGAPDQGAMVQRCLHEWAETPEEVTTAYQKYRSWNLEGLIGKLPNAPYEFKRSKNWTKIKDILTMDLRVTDVIEGKGKYVGMMGALEVDHKGVKTNIGTGFSDQQRQDFWAKREEIRREGLLIEVTAHEVTPDGSLRHGRFEKVRWDKSEAEGE